MAVEAGGFTATPLPGGNVLIVGRRWVDHATGSAPSFYAEVYDAATGWFNPTRNLGTTRTDHTATPLPDGRVLLAGGSGVLVGNREPLSTAELYDPATGLFSATGNLITAQWGHVAVIQGDGRVLILGGVGAWGSAAGMEVYDPATGRFSATGAVDPGGRGLAATLLPEGRVLILGGIEGAPPRVFDPFTWTFSATGPLFDQRGSGVAMALMPNGSVLVTGGGPNSAEWFDPVSRTFKLNGQ
jgi:hypothetical protein